MSLYDVNVLIYAHREEMPLHKPTRAWLEAEFSGSRPCLMSELVLSSFMRIVTNPQAFKPPTRIEVALEEVDRLLQNPRCTLVRPGLGHLEIFLGLCRQTSARGKAVSDAYLAALAIERKCRWYSFDRDFARFPGLDWAVPPVGN